MARVCGECGVCCDIVEVKDLDKPAGQLCKFFSGGCSIYESEERPPVCGKFACAWLRGFGDARDRPDRLGLMMAIADFNGGRYVYAIENRRGALERSARMLEAVIDRVYLPVVVSNYDTPFGSDYGDRIVLRDSMKIRSSKVAGEHLAQLGPFLHVYKLIVAAA